VGILIEFFAERTAGDVDRIVAAIEDGDWPDASQPFVGASADFSLHIAPDDLDPLIEAICARAGVPPTTLTGSLVASPSAADPEATQGAERVSPELVRTIANLPEADAGALSVAWLQRLGEDPSDDAASAVRDLIRLCRQAAPGQLAVVLAWGL
jgi:hypothetical protein